MMLKEAEMLPSSCCDDIDKIFSIRIGKRNVKDREIHAKKLAAKHGISPESIIPNTLDEEPCDGMLPLDTPGHYAWRDYLWIADKYPHGG
jgi:hypothetical protein